MISSWRDIPGFFDFEDIYDQAVEEARSADRFVEVGCFLGKSTAYLAGRIRDSGKILEFFAVDTWDDNEYAAWWVDVESNPPVPWPVEELRGMPLYGAFHYAIAKAGVRNLIQPVRIPSISCAAGFAPRSLSFVFIDADHRYESVRQDIEAWCGKVKPGGILAGHDYRTPYWPGVTQAVDETFPSVEHRGNSWLVRM